MLADLHVLVEGQARELFNLKKELEAAQKENTEFYDFNAAMYFTLDSLYCIQRVNFKAACFLDVDRSVLMHQLFFNYMTEHSQHILKHTIQTLLEVNFKQMCDLELLQKGGARKFVRVTCMLLHNKLIRLHLKDITYLRQLENERFDLDKSANTLHNLIEHVTDAIAAVDSAYAIKVINPSFIRVLSEVFSFKVQVGMNLAMMLSDFPELKDKIISACEEATSGKIAYVLLDNAQEVHQVYYSYEIIISSIDYTDTQNKDLVLHIRNLTKINLEKMAQHKRLTTLALSTRTTAIGEMASAFAHEITQPLAAINAYSQSCLHLLNKALKKEEVVNELKFPLEQISRQAEKAGSIIHHMNHFMRDEVIVFETTDMNALIHETLTVLYYETLDIQLKISLDLMDALPEVMTNKTHMMQIILNLVRNSVESFSISSTSEHEIILKTRRLKDTLYVRVMDNGKGINKALKDLELGSYYSTKTKGTGLGLGICRSLVEAHGGRFFVQKQRIKGARFTFTLPIKKEGVA